MGRRPTGQQTSLYAIRRRFRAHVSETGAWDRRDGVHSHELHRALTDPAFGYACEWAADFAEEFETGLAPLGVREGQPSHLWQAGESSTLEAL